MCAKKTLLREKISGCDVLSDRIVSDGVVYGRAMKRAIDSQIENKNWHQNSSCIPHDYSRRSYLGQTRISSEKKYEAAKCNHRRA